MKKYEKGRLCPACSSELRILHSNMYDDRFGYPGFFTLLECPSCSHILLAETLDEASLEKLYTDYYPRSNFSMDRHRPYPETRGFKGWRYGVRSSAFNWVPRDVRILDIGCGFGESLAFHRKRGCEVYGVEADENVRSVAEHFGYKIHIGPFDPGIYEAGFFDYVTMDQVLEHFADPVPVLQGIVRILKGGGTVVVSTPNATGIGKRVFRKRWVHWHVPYHRQFFSRKSMVLFAEQAGLRVKGAKSLTSSEWLFYQWQHLFTLPPMGTPSLLWRSLDRKQESRHSVLYGLCANLHRIIMEQAPTRFLDLLGLSDNYIFLLEKE